MLDDYYQIKTPAASEPVTLAEAKKWTKQDEITVDDDILTALIAGFRKDGEDYTNRVFVERTFEGFFVGLDSSNQERYPFIQIRRAPLLLVSSVEVSIDDSFESVTEYEIKRNSEFSRLIFLDTSELTNADNIPYPIKVTFTAGYGAASAVPEGIKAAIKAHLFFLYANRGDTAPESKKGMPVEVEHLYNSFRILNTF